MLPVVTQAFLPVGLEGDADSAGTDRNVCVTAQKCA